MGCYYLTVHRRASRRVKGERHRVGVFAARNEVFLAFSQKQGRRRTPRSRCACRAHKKLKGEGEKEFTARHDRRRRPSAA